MTRVVRGGCLFIVLCGLYMCFMVIFPAIEARFFASEPQTEEVVFSPYDEIFFQPGRSELRLGFTLASGKEDVLRVPPGEPIATGTPYRLTYKRARFSKTLVPLDLVPVDTNLPAPWRNRQR